MTDFREFAKIPRLSRECVITEKIDGTNASIFIGPGEIDESCIIANNHTEASGSLVMKAGSRTRWITPDDDNFGFARWAQYHAEELFTLGPGHHFGEWWGVGIQRHYNLSERRFSLFNTSMWGDLCVKIRPPCCHVVPVLAQGVFSSVMTEGVLLSLREVGSQAAPGFAQPEGIIIYHTAAGHYYKQTLDGDGAKSSVKRERPAKEGKPKPEGIMWTGGRRKSATAGYAGPERRKG